jgi:hypothetical protein
VKVGDCGAGLDEEVLGGTERGVVVAEVSDVGSAPSDEAALDREAEGVDDDWAVVATWRAALRGMPSAPVSCCHSR